MKRLNAGRWWKLHPVLRSDCQALAGKSMLNPETRANASAFGNPASSPDLASYSTMRHASLLQA
jgi:hypothetical protein